MSGYTKLFNSIVTSTIWEKDSDTKVVWITMLALSDADGYVEASVPGLARVSCVTLEAVKKALDILKAPDEYSRTPDNEGRRIEEREGGWIILNRAKYRDKDWKEEKSARHREANRRYYDKKSDSDISDNSDIRLSDSDTFGDKKEKEKENTKPAAFFPIDCARGFLVEFNLTGEKPFRGAEQAIALRSKLRSIEPQAACDELVAEYRTYLGTPSNYRKSPVTWLSECNVQLPPGVAPKVTKWREVSEEELAANRKALRESGVTQ